MAQYARANEARFQPYHEEFESLVEEISKLAWTKDWNFKAMMFGNPKIRGA